MATYFVSSTGSNTAPYDTWAKAATSLATALAAATADNDVIALDVAGVPSADAEVAGTTTWSFAGNVSLICSTNSGTSTITPTVMSTTYWIGNSTAARVLTLNGIFRVYVYGLTIRSHNGVMTLNGSDGGQFIFEECLVWNSSTTSTTTHVFGVVSNSATFWKKCTFKHDRASTSTDAYRFIGYQEVVGCTFTTAFAYVHAGLIVDTAGSGHHQTVFTGCDFSTFGSGATLVANNTRTSAETWFVQCKLPTSYVAMATQTTVPNKASARVYVLDCASGDTHGLFGYYDALGSVVSDTGIYFTAGAAAQSWKIATTANCSYYTPFETPWFGYYNSTLSAVTPYIEILRDGSATAYQDDEVWIDVLAKTTTGSTQSSLSTDRMTLLGTPANQAAGAGTGSWTGEGGTAWSGKIGLGASITPAENGHISARIVVGEPSITVYADPQIRV